MPAVTRATARVAADTIARQDANGTARTFRVARRERTLREREAERLWEVDVVKYNTMVRALKALYPGGVLDERASLFCEETIHRVAWYMFD
jgi:hypothetical protein